MDSVVNRDKRERESSHRLDLHESCFKPLGHLWRTLRRLACQFQVNRNPQIPHTPSCRYLQVKRTPESITPSQVNCCNSTARTLLRLLCVPEVPLHAAPLNKAIFMKDCCQNASVHVEWIYQTGTGTHKASIQQSHDSKSHCIRTRSCGTSHRGNMMPWAMKN